MNRYYCIKCRRKLQFNSHSEWSSLLTEQDIEQFHAQFWAWECTHCNIVYVFLNSSGNRNSVLTLIHLTKESDNDG